MKYALLLTLAASFSLPVAAQEPAVKKVPAPYTSPTSGKDMYAAYCASCHGAKGQGDGPVAVHLKVLTPDLSQMAKNNKGVFPGARVAQVIRGQIEAQSHGTLDMPVWGPVFRSFNERQESVVQTRVSNLTKYLETMQAK